MADIRPGEPFTPGFLIRSVNGSPETSGVSGTLVLDSPTTSAVTSGALSHQGGGVWGFTVAGSFTGTAGTYTYRVASLVTPAGTLVNQSGTFDVGYNNAWTVRDLLTRIREDLDDGWTGTTSGSGSTTTLVASAFAYGSNNDWLASELLFFEPGAVADTNPVRVTAFVASTGTFTVTPAVTSTVAGQDFIIGNKDGQGWRHAQIMGAIQVAARECGTRATITDEIATTFLTTTAEYTVPAPFSDVTAVAYQPPSSTTGEWLPIAPRYWAYQRDRRRLVFTRVASGVYGNFTWPRRWGQGFDIPTNSRLRITGYAALQVPSATALNATIDADPRRIYDVAMTRLLGLSKDPADRQRAVMLAGMAGRPPVRMP